MTELKPAEVFHPGDALRDMLASSGKYGDLVNTGLSPDFIQRLLDGNARINSVTAKRLAAGLGTSASLWVNLQDQYDRYQEREWE